jgi:hypothetical protein
MSCSINYPISLNYLGNLEGMYDGNQDAFGAEFSTIYPKRKYFEKLDKQYVRVPWLGQNCESTFFNRTKVLNEPPVLSYKDLKLTSISQVPYQSINISDYGIEGFGNNNKSIMFVTIVILIIVLIFLQFY